MREDILISKVNDRTMLEFKSEPYWEFPGLSFTLTKYKHFTGDGAEIARSRRTCHPVEQTERDKMLCQTIRRIMTKQYIEFET